MPRYPDPPNASRDPFVIRAADESEAYTIYPAPAPAQHATIDPYRTPPGMQLVDGDGQPAYALLPEPAQRGADPRLVNAALAVAVLLGIGAACWMAAAFITALAALLQTVALIIAIVFGSALALKFLAGTGSATHIDVKAGGRARVHINTRRGRRALPRR
ncbi:hypothetical protein ACFVTP_33000 [Streptomyces celluloflavus]|uniref:hypothetical protein n=1 Tax=Streptomyces celluloflavus TaxID=58344 RepID=UPI0036DDE805